jgi:hypothetical protein
LLVAHVTGRSWATRELAVDLHARCCALQIDACVSEGGLTQDCAERARQRRIPRTRLSVADCAAVAPRRFAVAAGAGRAAVATVRH